MVSIDVTSVENINPYSREETKLMCSSQGFGYRKNDDIYEALNNVYSSNELKERYGEDFEITYEQLQVTNAEGNTYFFSFLYDGRSNYSFSFDDGGIYSVVLKKKTYSKWEVIESFFEQP